MRLGESEMPMKCGENWTEESVLSPHSANKTGAVERAYMDVIVIGIVQIQG